ncbi:hypothetical protein HYC85_020942 [Camellia sinensis]|uniref:Pentatricopeptide repeat-containing protein n=1 Tax=Camellia sinensis TaxID=4442 RepID=A0A7J7GRI5_CAMSI|nr:hypothetical protein HYC85_020942 [Camellia sinensis]
MKRTCQKKINNLNKILEPTSVKSPIHLLCHLGRLQDALKLIFSNPTRSNYSLHSKILQLCIKRKAKMEGRLIHSHFLTNGLHSNAYLNTNLVIFYSRLGDMVNSPYSKEALVVFSAMHRIGVKANQFTYRSTLRACTSMMCLDRGKQIEGCIQKSRLVKNLFVQSALVDLHSKCGKSEDACVDAPETLTRCQRPRVRHHQSCLGSGTWKEGGHSLASGCVNDACLTRLDRKLATIALLPLLTLPCSSEDCENLGAPLN